MMKWFGAVCICLSGLALSAGCTGGKSAPSPLAPIPPVAEPNESAAQEIDKTPIASQARIEPSRPTDKPPLTIGPSQPSGGHTTPQADKPHLPAPLLQGYTGLLRDYVRDDGSVDYGSLHRRRLEVGQLLMALDGLDPNAYAGWPDADKLAFWINVYNLKMLDIITRNYPIQSSWWLRLTWPPSDIRHITGIWTDYKFVVIDEEFTLAEVERRFFHKTFGDPRVYLAIAYASRSGPPLRNRPYRGEGLDRQLDEQVRAFLASPQGFRIDRQAMTVRLSALFKPAWRGKEFVPHFGTDKKFKDRDPETRAVLSFIMGYLSREDAYFLETENYTIEYIPYDWRLNDTSRDY
jgi:hypothetical protein